MSTPSWAGRQPLQQQRKHSTSHFAADRDAMFSSTSSREHFQQRETPPEAREPIVPHNSAAVPGRHTPAYPGVAPAMTATKGRPAKATSKRKTKLQNYSQPASTDYVPQVEGAEAQAGEGRFAERLQQRRLDKTLPKQSALKASVVRRDSTCLYSAKPVEYHIPAAGQ